MSKVPMGLLAGLAATLVFAASAVAAPGDGAQVIDYNYCQPDGANTLCADGHSVYKTTQTPSGNTVVAVNDSYHISVDGPGCHSDNTGQDHYTYLLRPEEFKQSHAVQSFDFNYFCYGTQTHCTFYNNTAFANGEVRAEKYEYVCEPV